MLGSSYLHVDSPLVNVSNAICPNTGKVGNTEEERVMYSELKQLSTAQIQDLDVEWL